MRSFKLTKYQADVATLLAASVGAFISIYLWQATVSSSEVICFTGCESVISGEYGKMLEVPVSAYGVAFYGVIMLLAYIRMELSGRVLDRLMLGILLTGVGFTIYLRYLEFFVIGDVCVWCWGSAVVVLLICILQYLGYVKKGVKGAIQ